MATYANVGHILLKRGNTIQSSNYTGVLGELSYNTETGEVSVHDNATAGGASTLASKEFVTTAILDVAAGNVDFTGYATETFVTSALADKADLTYVDDIVASVNASLDLKLNTADLPTIPVDIADLTDTGNLLVHTSLTGYATETYVDDAVANVAVSGNGMVERTVNFPLGETGDTAGVLAFTPDGELFVSTTDFPAPQEFSAVTVEDFSSNQTGGQSLVFELLTSDHTDIETILNNATIAADWTLSADLGDYGTGPWQVTEIYTGNSGSGAHSGEPVISFFVADIGNVEIDIPTDTAFTLNYVSTNPIWRKVDNGNLRIDTWGGPGNDPVRLTHQTYGESILIQSTDGYNNGRSSLRWHSRPEPEGNGSRYSQVDVQNDGVWVKNADWSGNGGSWYWQFTNDGTLVFPDGSRQVTAGGGVVSQTLPAAITIAVEPEGCFIDTWGGTIAEIDTGLMTKIYGDTSADDSYVEITSLPFDITFLGQTYSNISVGTNGYITFGGSTSNYDFGDDPTMGGANLPAILISEADNSFQRVYTYTTGNTGAQEFTIRYEGTAQTSGDAGNPTITWQVTFYEATPFINILIIRDDRNSYGISGVTDGTNWVLYEPISGRLLPRTPWQSRTYRDIEFVGATLSIDEFGKISVGVSGGGANTGTITFTDNTLDANGNTGFLNLDNGTEVIIGSNTELPVKVSVNESGTAKDWVFGTDGSLTFPDNTQMLDSDGLFAISQTNGVIVAAGEGQFAKIDSTEGFQIQTNSGNNIWTFDNNGALTFPDSTVQTTAFNGNLNVDPVVPDHAWAVVVGDALNNNGYNIDNSNNLLCSTVCALADGSVMVGGSWFYDYNAIVYQFDKNGKELWRWQIDNGTNSRVTAISQNPFEPGIVAVATKGNVNNGAVDGTRVYIFGKVENSNNWEISSAFDLRDNENIEWSTVQDMLWKDINNLVYFGASGGESPVAFTGQPNVTGSGIGVLAIAKADITTINGLYPYANDSNWELKLGGSSWGSYPIGRYNGVAYTSAQSNTTATFDVLVNYNTGAYEVYISASGTGYSVGDSFTVDGSVLDGQSGTNDLTFEVAQVSSGHIAAVGNVTGTPDTTYVRWNFKVYGNNTDYTQVTDTYTVVYNTNSDATIFDSSNEWQKTQRQPGNGFYFGGVYAATDDAYYAVGYVEDAGNYSSSTITKIATDGSLVWSKQLENVDHISDVTTSGTGCWAVSNYGQIFELDATGAVVNYSYVNDVGQYNNSGGHGIKYQDGFLYVGGSFYPNYPGGGVYCVEKINATTYQTEWARLVSNSAYQEMYPYDDDNYPFTVMDVNSEGVFLTGNSWFWGEDNYVTGFVFKLPLTNPPGATDDFVQPPALENLWTIVGNFDGTQVASMRLTGEIGSQDRTADEWVNATLAIDYGISYDSSVTPRFMLQYSTLDNSKGVDFSDNTPVLTHNPAYVPPAAVPWGYIGNEYYLKPSDAGKFIRSSRAYQTDTHLYVPSETEVNFPIGTVITIINMNDYDQFGTYIHVHPTDSNETRIFLAGQGNSFSPSWGVKGVGTATLMKVGPEEWLLTGDCVNTD